MPAAFKTLKHHSGDIEALQSQITIYRYILLYVVGIVDNTVRHYVDFGRDGVINLLEFLKSLASE